MSFDSLERSEQSAAPVELYEFFVGGTSIVHRYTSADSDQTYLGNTFESIPIKRSAVAISIEMPRNAIKVEVPRNNEVADLFRRYAPVEPVGLIVKRFHRSEPANTGTLWVGRVLNCKWERTSKAVLNCEPASISLKRLGLARVIQVPCPWAWGGVDCGADKNDFDHATTIGAINGAVVTVASKNGALNYPGGWIEWNDGNSPPIYERRLIISVSGLNFTLNRPFSTDVAVTDDVVLFPGCDHTIEMCDDDYDRALAYGGFLFMPEKNPFDGAPVY